MQAHDSALPGRIPWRRMLVASAFMAAAFCAAQDLSNKRAEAATAATADDGSIDKDKKAEFLKDRKKDLVAAASPQWSAWLRELSDSKSLDARAWAMARRLEAGDYSCYLAFEQIIFDHVMAISKKGYSAGKLRSSNRFPGDDGSPLQINGKSVFWKSFEKTIRSDEKLAVSPGQYSIWCFNTSPEQRDLILDLAKQADAGWKDPRFWIVMDWLYAWGSLGDFEIVQESLPKPSRTTFKRLYYEVQKLPGFAHAPPSAIREPRDEDAPKKEAANNDEAMVAVEIGEPPAEPTKTKGIRIKSRPSFQQLQFPVEATARGLIAELYLQIVVGKDGKPKSCRPLPGPWLTFFAPSGIKYGMGFVFEPPEDEGRFSLQIQFRR